MKRTIESRNRREGRYGGRYPRAAIKLQVCICCSLPNSRHFRTFEPTHALRYRGREDEYEFSGSRRLEMGSRA